MEQAISLIALVLAIEIFARFLYRFGNKIPQIAGGIQFVDFIRSGIKAYTGPYESRPYGLYWNRADYNRKGMQQTDMNGFRWKGYNIERSKPDSTIRILAYGGSTTFSNHVFWDPEKCWTFLLERKLQVALGNEKRVEIINAGLNYGTTAELLSHYVFEGHKFSADYVMIHGPGNDMMPVSIGDLSTDYRNTRESTNLYPRKFETSLLRVSGFLRIVYAYWLRESVVAKLEPEEWESPLVQNERMLNTAPLSFYQNIFSFCQLAMAHSAKIVFVDFLQNHEGELERMKPGLSEGMIEIVSKMNEYFESLKDRYKENSFHIRLHIKDFLSSDFVDTCHLTEIGEMKKAELIASEMEKILNTRNE